MNGKKIWKTIEKASGYRLYFKDIPIGPVFESDSEEFLWRMSLHLEFMRCMTKNPNRLPRDKDIPNDFVKRVASRVINSLKSGTKLSQVDIDQDTFFWLRLWQGQVTSSGLDQMKAYADKENLESISQNWEDFKKALLRRASQI